MLFLLDTTVILFYISFICIVGMIYLKSYEIKNSKRFWYRNFFDKVDIRIRIIIDYTKKFIALINKSNAIALIQWIAYHILSWIREAYIWLHKKARSHPPSKKVMDMVRGKGEVKKNGGVSFFLRRIVEDDKV